MNVPGNGRYAPSPSGDLHLGNLRTAVLAWIFAKRSGRGFRMRIDDIDTQRSSEAAAQRQLEDLAALGLTWEEPAIRQTDAVSQAAYAAALQSLQRRGFVYECWCTRRDIQEAVRAAHKEPGVYPGTCRPGAGKALVGSVEHLGVTGVAGAAISFVGARYGVGGAGGAFLGRIPALRFRADRKYYIIREAFSQQARGGFYRGCVDDFVLRRGGVAGQVSEQDFAYNLAVVVDDFLAGVDQVVRGDDLLGSAARQAYLGELLGFPAVQYVHVPLVLGSSGRKLSKRDAAVTLRELVPGGELHECAAVALRWIAQSIGCVRNGGMVDEGQEWTLEEIAQRFDPQRLPHSPVMWRADA